MNIDRVRYKGRHNVLLPLFTRSNDLGALSIYISLSLLQALALLLLPSFLVKKAQIFDLWQRVCHQKQTPYLNCPFPSQKDSTLWVYLRETIMRWSSSSTRAFWRFLYSNFILSKCYYLHSVQRNPNNPLWTGVGDPGRIFGFWLMYVGIWKNWRSIKHICTPL